MLNFILYKVYVDMQ